MERVDLCRGWVLSGFSDFELYKNVELLELQAFQRKHESHIGERGKIWAPTCLPWCFALVRVLTSGDEKYKLASIDSGICVKIGLNG